MHSRVRSDALLLRRNNGSVAAGREKTKRITLSMPKSGHKVLRDFAYEGDTDGMRVVRVLLLELRDDPRASSCRPACSEGHRSYEPPGGLVLAGETMENSMGGRVFRPSLDNSWIDRCSS